MGCGAACLSSRVASVGDCLHLETRGQESADRHRPYAEGLIHVVSLLVSSRPGDDPVNSKNRTALSGLVEGLCLRPRCPRT